MNTAWYVVKVLPGKERSLTEQFNKDIGFLALKIPAREFGISRQCKSLGELTPLLGVVDR